MSQGASKQPTFWIIAGPNGSGKSTAYSMMSAEEPAGSIWIINPDALAARIASHEGLALLPDANLEAVRRIEAWLYASVAAHQTVGVETVLSTDKYRALVGKAKAQGFRIRAIFVFLDNADMNVERVRIRTTKGGHAVPEDKIRQRWPRSFDNFAWLLREADQADAFNNSGASPRHVLSKRGDTITLLEAPHPALSAVLEAAYPFED